MSDAALYLTEADVSALVDLNDVIDALEADLTADGRGAALSLPKALGVFGDTNIHALGSALPQDGWAGFKSWINNPRGAAGKYLLFDADGAQLAAVMDIGLLGMLRTAGISGLATQIMAAADADELALVGTGRQAMMQIAAVAVVRPLKRVRVFSPTPNNRMAFAERASSQFPFAVEAVPSVEAALADAPIVTLVSRATKPFVSADMLAPGAHVNAVGAILPANAEIAGDVFDRAGLVAVDSLSDVKRASREFIDRFEGRPNGWAAVKTLGAVLAEGFDRPRGDQITLFKAMGMGLSDLSAAKLVLERARAAGRGMTLPPAERPIPRWRLPDPVAREA